MSSSPAGLTPSSHPSPPSPPAAIIPLPAKGSVFYRVLAGIALSLGVSVSALLAYASTQTTDLWGDVRLIARVGMARRRLSQMIAADFTAATLFAQQARSRPDEPALFFFDRQNRLLRFSFRQLDEASNQVANWALSQGIEAGSVVALMMDNRPEFVAAFLGLAKVGAVAALLNCHLRHHSLAHCVRISEAHHFIVGVEHAHTVAECFHLLNSTSTTSGSSGSTADSTADSTAGSGSGSGSGGGGGGSTEENNQLRSDPSSTLTTTSADCLQYHCWGGAVPGFHHLDPRLALSPRTPPSPQSSPTISTSTTRTEQNNNNETKKKVKMMKKKKIDSNSTLCLIYTSGTTGLPKASVVKHLRFLMAGLMFAESLGITAQDRIYCTLPLYHSAGGMVGLGLSWHSGAALVIRRRFSVQRWWPDICEANCTVAQYIGQLCRYLLNAPPHPLERRSPLRILLGNGMRADVWSRLIERLGGPKQSGSDSDSGSGSDSGSDSRQEGSSSTSPPTKDPKPTRTSPTQQLKHKTSDNQSGDAANVPRVAEFYGSTEGNVALLNTRNRLGAVGYLSPLLQPLLPMRIVRFDADSEQPVRSALTGRCVPCAVGEVGEMLGRIDQDDPTRRFHGYTSAQATDRKILRDVFRTGDRWFRTGDLLRQDAEGFFYFVDRIGDTFRWKGENVATNEVSLVIDQVPGVAEANVYGVEVPNQDGRAGMACIVTQEGFNLQTLFDTCKEELPSYARPLFVRLRSQMEITATFKHRKVTYVKQGFDPAQCEGDDVYIRDDQQGCFVKMTDELLKSIRSGQLARL